MRILLTGATGFVGRALAPCLIRDGHDLVFLSRSPHAALASSGLPGKGVQWDLNHAPPPQSILAGIDAVIHLAGESVAAGRWSAQRKKEIQDSRWIGTRHLVQAWNQSQKSAERPGVFISTSAVGFYGDGGDTWLFETSPAGSGFLADVCRQWEKIAQEAGEFGARVAILRLGVVLGSGGGALERMLPAFSLGLGARLGSGEQWMSWIHLADVVAAICEVLVNPSASGPINVVAPNPVTNGEFTSVLAGVVQRPAFLVAPKFLLQALLGEMSSVVLASARVRPQRLEALGLQFGFPDLPSALQEICSRAKIS